MLRSFVSFCGALVANRFAAVALASALCVGMSAAVANATIIYPGNNGFEVPNQNGSYVYRPAGASWTFVGNTGIASNSSPFNVQNAPNGNSDGTISFNGQAGLVQGGNGTTSGGGASYFYQNIDLSSFTYSGTLTVSWVNEARVGNAHDYNVILHSNTFNTDTLLGTYFSTSGSIFTPQSTAPVAYNAGESYALYFVGINSIGGDRTSFIDNVSLNITEIIPAPEPSSLLLLGMGVMGLVARRRRNAGSQA